METTEYVAHAVLPPAEGMEEEIPTGFDLGEDGYLSIAGVDPETGEYEDEPIDIHVSQLGDVIDILEGMIEDAEERGIL